MVLDKHLGTDVFHDEAPRAVGLVVAEVAELRAGRDALRRERETLIAERAQIATALGVRVDASIEMVDAAIRRLFADRTDDGSPAYDGRAVQALLDAHGYPLREFGPVVRVMRLLGIQGVDLPGGER